MLESTEILETLGEGSFGKVYVARISEGAFERTVVLKVLKSNWVGNDEILKRARDEAVLLGRLNHDNIVRVEQLTEIDGRPAVVMEHVQGLTLDRIVKAHGPFPAGVAVGIAMKVANALDAAYNREPAGGGPPLRVVHRDIKPSNIILSVSGAVKVLDFGTARADFGARGARTSSLTIGSPLYMAPEAFDGLEADPSVDIYALGATLYELIAGVPMGKLSVNPARHAERKKKRLGQLRSPAIDDDAVLAAVRKLIEKCVRYDPTRRPTAADMKRLCGEFVKRLPRTEMGHDGFAETVVEPLYQSRERVAPDLIEPTMSGSNLERQAQTQPTQPQPPKKKGRGLLIGVVALLVGLGIVGAVALSPSSTPDVEVEPVVAPPATDAAPSRRERDLQERRERAAAAADHREDPAVELPEEDLLTPKGDQRDPVERASTEPLEVFVEPLEVFVEPVEVFVEPAEDTVGAAVVRLVSLPAGAEVQVQGRTVKTPGSATLVPGGSTVTVTFPDGESRRCSVRLSAGGQLAFRQDPDGISCP